MTRRRQRADRNSLPMLLAQARRSRGVGPERIWVESADPSAEGVGILPEAEDGAPWNDAYRWRPGDRVL
jgi:hypothetical protein